MGDMIAHSLAVFCRQSSPHITGLLHRYILLNILSSYSHFSYLNLAFCNKQSVQLLAFWASLDSFSYPEDSSTISCTRSCIEPVAGRQFVRPYGRLHAWMVRTRWAKKSPIETVESEHGNACHQLHRAELCVSHRTLLGTALVMRFLVCPLTL